MVTKISIKFNHFNKLNFQLLSGPEEKSLTGQQVMHAPISASSLGKTLSRRCPSSIFIHDIFCLSSKSCLLLLSPLSFIDRIQSDQKSSEDHELFINTVKDMNILIKNVSPAGKVRPESDNAIIDPAGFTRERGGWAHLHPGILGRVRHQPGQHVQDNVDSSDDTGGHLLHQHHGLLSHQISFSYGISSKFPQAIKNQVEQGGN